MIEKKKHSFEFKLYCVKQILEFHHSVKSIAKEYGITHSLVKRWCIAYDHSGVQGLLPRKGKRNFSPSFKLNVLRVIQEENLSLMEACVRFDLSTEAMIISWQKRLDKFGSEGLEPRAKGRPPMTNKENQPNKRKPRKANEPLTREEELLRENEYLRAENALLKKLQALAQAENKRKP